MLDDIGRSTLFTFRECSENRILPGAPESVTKLQVILVLDLADADFSQVRLVLRTNAGDDFPLGVQRMGCGLEIVFIFQH